MIEKNPSLIDSIHEKKSPKQRVKDAGGRLQDQADEERIGTKASLRPCGDRR
jgi:hypothetical protein